MMQGAGGRQSGGLSFRPTGNIGSSRNTPGVGAGNTSFWQMGQTHAQGAIGAYQGQHPDSKQTTQGPPKTLGGGLSSGAGMGLAGFAIGGMPGLIVGGAVGVLSYLLS